MGYQSRQGASLLLLLGLSTSPLPAAAQTVEVAVDGTSPGKPVNPVWSYFGYDEVNNTTTAESQELLKALTQVMASEVRIRTHFLLDNVSGPEGLKWGATDVYREDGTGKAVYDFTILDQVMDAITAAGARPYAEIAFMPQALTRYAGPYRNSRFDALDGGLFYPPKNDAWTKWAGLIRAWAQHTKERYPDAATTWSWELWNEPNIGYWHGSAAEYYQLYDYTEQALHEVLPGAPLGGPETAGVGADFLQGFLQHCASGTNSVGGQTGARLDSISFHAKGGVDMNGDHPRMDLGSQLAQHQSGFRIVAGSAKFKSTPIIIGEADPDGCAACSAPPANAYRTTAAYGVYEMAMMKHSQTLADKVGVTLQGVVTWAWMFNGLPYFANFRQLQTNGIHLPVLNAFKMLGALKGNVLPVKSSGALGADAIVMNKVRAAPDIDGLATATDSQLRAIVWNYHDDLTAAAPAQVSLRIKVPSRFGPVVTLEHLRFDEQNASSTAKWVALGKPAAPSPEQITMLKQASELVALEAAHDVDVTNGEVTATFTLPRNGASLILIDSKTAPGSGSGGTAGSAGQAPLGGQTSQAGGGNAGSPAGGAPASGGAPSSAGNPPAATTAGAPTANAPESAADCGCRLPGDGSERGEYPLELLACLLGLITARRRAHRVATRSALDVARHDNG